MVRGILDFEKSRIVNLQKVSMSIELAYLGSSAIAKLPTGTYPHFAL
jgi:hypothetical protein